MNTTNTHFITTLTAAAPQQFFVFAGPCVIESKAFALETAKTLKEIFAQADIPWVYKSSFDKANRSSSNAFRGVGIEAGLDILNTIKMHYQIPVITDVHEISQIAPVAKVVDILQTPAFLCRQTDFIAEVARSGKPVNIKKGQFLAPWEMKNVIDKARYAAQAKQIKNPLFFACERGTSFGYNNLVVDMRSLIIMQETTACPIVFDATHSVQLPGAQGNQSGGQRQYAAALAQAAVATGAVSGVFMEVHPDPDQAPCDGANMLPFSVLPDLLRKLKAIYECSKR